MKLIIRHTDAMNSPISDDARLGDEIEFVVRGRIIKIDCPTTEIYRGTGRNEFQFDEKQATVYVDEVIF